MANYGPHGMLGEQEQTRRYHESLGEFVDAFSSVEGALFIAVSSVAKLTLPVARALLSGARVDTANGLLRRLMLISETDQERRKETDAVLTQLGHINDVRNQILHYGADPVPDKIDERISSNFLVALTDKHRKEIPVSPTLLNDMTADLRKIMAYLLINHGDFSARAHADTVRTFAHLLHASWRYKPHQPKRQKPTRKKAARQQSPRPSSSE
ncbi:MAG: hypothetical protein AB7P52_09590 [Alphaproteobacteria bacterium]